VQRSLFLKVHVFWNITPFLLVIGTYLNVRVWPRVDVRGSVHHNTNLIEMTHKMQLFRTIYYSIVS